MASPLHTTRALGPHKPNPEAKRARLNRPRRNMVQKNSTPQVSALARAQKQRGTCAHGTCAPKQCDRHARACSAHMLHRTRFFYPAAAAARAPDSHGRCWSA